MKKELKLRELTRTLMQAKFTAELASKDKADVFDEIDKLAGEYDFPESEMDSLTNLVGLYLSFGDVGGNIVQMFDVTEEEIRNKVWTLCKGGAE